MPIFRSAAAFALLVLGGCATIRPQPVSLQPSAPERFVLVRTLILELETGYQRVLAGQSQWQHVGTLAQGEVFKPVGAVLTVEGADVHEAYLVVHDATLVGFYLPAEHGFTNLGQHRPIQLEKERDHT